MATIAENIQTLRSIKSDIKNAIIQKGGSVTDAFGTYAQAITDLPSGGGGGTEIEDALIMRTLSGTYYNNRVSEVANYAFYNYEYSLKSVNIPNCKYVGRFAFAGCKSLLSIDLPLCSEIDNAVFSSCYSLGYANLQNCKYVGNDAFQECRRLSMIDLPICSFIGGYAFRFCSALSYINLPNCKSINTATFLGCNSLTSINLQLCSSIAEAAFENCYLLPSIDLPNCNNISSYVFSGCSKLSIVKLPKLNYLSRFHLSNCSSLRQLYINGGSQIVSLGSYASYVFSGLSMAAIYVPSSLYSDYVNSIYNKWGYMSSFIAPYSQSVQSLFVNLNDGTSSVVEMDTTFIPKLSLLLENYNSIETIVSPNCESVMYFGLAMLYSLTNISLPNCTNINDFGIYYCSSLSSIDLPKCSYIGAYAFGGCINISITKIPTCLNVKNYAFDNCSNLREVYLDSVTSVTTISSRTFSNCPNLTSVYVPSSLVDAFKTAQYWSSISTKIVAYTGA